MSLPGDARANLTVSPQSIMHDLAVKFVQEVSTSAARFFAAESLLVLVSLSLSGVSLRLSGLLARQFIQSSKTQVAYLALQV